MRSSFLQRIRWREIIAAASIAERKSEHPFSKAILARADELEVPVVEPDEFSYTPGKGVRVTYRGEEILVGSPALLRESRVTNFELIAGQGSNGYSEIYVARDGQILGSIRIADVLRPEAKEAVAAMRRMGLKTVLLSIGRPLCFFCSWRRLRCNSRASLIFGKMLPQDFFFVMGIRAKNAAAHPWDLLEAAQWIVLVHPSYDVDQATVSCRDLSLRSR